MSVAVSIKDLLDACEWVSGGEETALDCEAYVRRTTGFVHWFGEGIEEEPPEEIEDGSLYIAVPRIRELELGRSLAVRFTKENLPDQLEVVQGFFRSKGAYGKFKSLLTRKGRIDLWHEYENTAKENALRLWCEENGFEPTA